MSERGKGREDGRQKDRGKRSDLPFTARVHLHATVAHSSSSVARLRPPIYFRHRVIL